MQVPLDHRQSCSSDGENLETIWRRETLARPQSESNLSVKSARSLQPSDSNESLKELNSLPKQNTGHNPNSVRFLTFGIDLALTTVPESTCPIRERVLLDAARQPEGRHLGNTV